MIMKVRRVAVKTLRCDICPYRTNKLGLLNIHKTYHRPQAKNTYKCPHCPYYVCAPRLLHQHTRIHLDTVQTMPNGDGSVIQVVGVPEYVSCFFGFHCFDAVGWAARRASDL